jgi:hypothetical protein
MCLWKQSVLALFASFSSLAASGTADSLRRNRAAFAIIIIGKKWQSHRVVHGNGGKRCEGRGGSDVSSSSKEAGVVQ